MLHNNMGYIKPPSHDHAAFMTKSSQDSVFVPVDCFTKCCQSIPSSQSQIWIVKLKVTSQRFVEEPRGPISTKDWER